MSGKIDTSFTTLVPVGSAIISVKWNTKHNGGIPLQRDIE
jgi:hypothetical protein